MEFGIFLQGHVPRRKVAQDPTYEHTSLINDTKLAVEADKAGFKYIWVSEHHFLEEYSHLSASETFLGYLAAITERIHIGSAIFNLSPPVNHPVRVAERAAMLDHLTNGRFEFGVGRGAGSREVTGFGIESTDATKPMFEEVLKELPKMWRHADYSFQGKYFAVPPRNVLPKPWVKPHPPIWQAAGNPPTYEKAARNGLGVLGFNFASYREMEPMVTAYKKAVGEAEPIGDYVNDNVMLTTTAVCLADGARARKAATDRGGGLLVSLVYRYHDTFPKPPEIPTWPDLIPEPDLEQVEQSIREGTMLCGTPDEVLGQLKGWESIGADQIVFGLPIDLSFDDTVETIRLLGKHVIPKLDPDPVHRTTKFREAALDAKR